MHGHYAFAGCYVFGKQLLPSWLGFPRTLLLKGMPHCQVPLLLLTLTPYGSGTHFELSADRYGLLLALFPDDTLSDDQQHLVYRSS